MISFEIIVEYLKFFQMKIELDEKNIQNVQIDMQDMLLKTIHITARPEGFEPFNKILLLPSCRNLSCLSSCHIEH